MVCRGLGWDAAASGRNQGRCSGGRGRSLTGTAMTALPMTLKGYSGQEKNPCFTSLCHVTLFLFESTSPVCVGVWVHGSVRCWRDNNARCARQCKQWQEAFRTGMCKRTSEPGNEHVGYEKRAFILLNGEEEVQGRI